jgi:hypothetical protein
MSANTFISVCTKLTLHTFAWDSYFPGDSKFTINSAICKVAEDSPRGFCMVFFKKKKFGSGYLLYHGY